MALDLLISLGLPTSGLRSKSWDEYAGPGAEEMDFVFTVCDAAAGESCPVWPGSPVTAHWGVPDPVKVEGDPVTRRNAFRAAYRQLETRITLFMSLRIAELDRISLKRTLDEIGRIRDPVDGHAFLSGPGRRTRPRLDGLLQAEGMTVTSISRIG